MKQPFEGSGESRLSVGGVGEQRRQDSQCDRPLDVVTAPVPVIALDPDPVLCGMRLANFIAAAVYGPKGQGR